MATMLRNESRRLYSWWWDSHISPKNSKWLQENLTDMDTKVKSMIKLIEEDADSFARRAEMYYKKRPELMKLVEEFYRAYRALAERYDHATVELRHAHRTMAQAFPDQVPFGIGDESQTCSSGPEGEPHAPELSLPMSALGISSTNSNNSAMSKRGLKQLNEMLNSECSGQNFEDGESEVSSGDQSLKKQIVFESDRAAKAETEVQSLKKTLAKVQAEKDTLLYQFQQNVEKLKNAERDLSVAQKDVTKLDEQVSEAEIDIKKLRESLSESESERDDGLLRLNDCLVRISSLEIRLSQAQEEGKGEKKRAAIAEAESESLRKEMSRLMTEKEAGLARYKKCLERISELESRIALAETNARLLGEQVEKSEAEVESLKKALVKMTEEKEAAELQYKQCLEIISMMEAEISRAQANTERLNSEILIGAAKLKSVEDQCVVLEGSNRTLQSEAYNLLDRISKKDRELSEKNDELAKFQSLVLDENAKFQQVEATLQALQKLHSQSQEDQRALASEVKDGLRMLKAVEMCKNGVEEELRRVKNENKSLNELNFSSALSVASLRDEILHLKEMKENLEDEVARRVGQSETLQQEIGTLNDEINGLKNRYFLIIKQVDSVGLNPECLESAVKDLRDENSKLKECCQRDNDEKEILRKRVNDMGELSTENIVLQDSMSGLKFELEDLRENVKKLQDSCDSLEGEKSTLVAEKVALLLQLQMITENMQKLFDKNSSLESSLSGANSELEQVRLRSKSLEDLCETLDSEKANLINERSDLVSQLANVEKRLGKLEIRFTELEEKYEDLKKEKNSTVDQVEELRSSLMAEKHERSSYVQSNEARLAGLTNDVRVLQDETKLGKKEFEEELDRAVNAQVEIFILQKFVEDLEEKNFSLLVDCQKHADAQKFSDKLISELESENLEQQVEAEYLVNEIEKLRLGIHLVFKALQIDEDTGKKHEQEQVSVRGILEDIEDLKSSLSVSEDEELKLMVENSVLLTLLAQMRDIGSGIESEKREFEIMNKRSNRQEEALKIELEALRVKMVNLQGSYVSLQEENSKVIEENRALVKKLLELKEEKSLENDVIVHEAAALSTLSMVLESFTVEKASALQSLSENLNALKVENVHWSDSVEVLRKKLSEVEDSNDWLSLQVLLEKDFLKAKSNELAEADEKIKITERLNGELCATVEELKFECEELKLNREILAQKIVELAEESLNRKIEVESLSEMNYELETKVGLLCQEIEEHRVREENLSTELREKGNEFELWEAEASGFYFDLQISVVREVLLENKVHELVGICESLEDERSAKNSEIEEIKCKVISLESHIGKLEAKLCDYVPVVASLRENVASLERNARMKAKLLEANDRAQKAHRREKSNEKLREGMSGEIPDGISDLKRMQRTIKAVEKAMVEEMEKLAVEAVEKAMEKEVERLAVRETNADPVADVRDRIAELKPRSDVNLMKDIQLDQVTDRSLYRSGMRHAGVPETDQKMLELWEAAEENRASSSSSSSVDAAVGPADEPRNQASELTEDTAEPRSRRQSGKSSSAQRSSSELHFERGRELGIDKLLERKQRGGAAATGNKAKILERLASDAQKLTSLQRSVADLKKKLETNGGNFSNNNKKGNNHRGNAAEFETVQRHLLEVEESVVELVGVNGRLARDAEESRKSSEGGKRVAEQARKGAEKIGQLQFEVQNINYILMKLDGGGGDGIEGAGEKSKGKASRFTGVLLKDFIYSSRRKRLRRKKSCFCGCAKPKTRED